MAKCWLHAGSIERCVVVVSVVVVSVVVVSVVVVKNRGTVVHMDSTVIAQ